MRMYILCVELYTILIVLSCYKSFHLGIKFPEMFAIIAAIVGIVIAVMCWIYLYKEEKKNKDSKSKDKV